jgi:hypothetical protein
MTNWEQNKPKKQVGTAAASLAMLAVVVHALFPLTPEVARSRVSQENARSEIAGAISPRESAGLEGPWLATRAFFNSVPEPPASITFDDVKPLLTWNALPHREREKWERVLGLPPDSHKTSPDVHKAWVIVATVADPVHSRMQLFFDGQIRSIENAVTLHGWEFAKQWLPWADSPKSSSGGIDDQHRERQLERQQETLPGILVFRRSSSDSETDVLFVLIVPESPTEGVAGDAFYAALNLARILSPEKIGLLAPTFSGSFESLTRFLKAWDKEQAHKGAIFKTVYGGSVSSSGNARKFQDEFRDGAGFKFRSAIASSNAYREAFKKILTAYSIKPDKAAYWVEEESGYGQSFLNDIEKEKIAIYTFPREISHLRAAYQEATLSSTDNNRNASPKLEISLKDLSHGEDSIPLFSDTHTPLEQSAAISTVTEEFRREGKEIVLIVATNTLDSLLLASFMRTESPDTRVLIGDADTLFIPAASQNSLAGTLFLSTYPMFILGQEWLTHDPEGQQGETLPHFVFPGPSQQGIFNVTQLLMAGIGADRGSAKGEGDCLYGYRPLKPPPIQEGEEYPGLWLLTLTNYGFLPVDWQPATDREWFDSQSISKCTSKSGNVPSEQFPLDKPSRGWYIAALGMSLTIGVACFLLLTNPAFAKKTWFPALLGAGLSLSATEWILLVPAWHVLLQAADRTTLVVVVASVILPLLSFLWINIPRKKSGIQWTKGSHRWTTPSYAVAIALLFFWICAWWFRANGGFWGTEKAQVLLFRLRAIELFPTSSPALGMFILGVVFAVGFLVYCFRYADASKVAPHPTFGDDNDRLIAEIDGSIEAPYGLRNGIFRRLVISLAVVAIVMGLVGRGMGAFEMLEFNYVLYPGLAVLFFSIATTCYDLIAIWRNFEAFLKNLELQPYPGKETLQRVTQKWPRRIVFGFWRASSGLADLKSKSVVCGDTDRVALDLCLYAFYAARQVQRIGWTIGLAFFALIAVLATYPLQAPQLVGRFLAVLFVVIGAIVVWVFAGIERNWILSRIDQTEPGGLSFEFWVQTAAVAALPFIGIVVHLFPSIGSFVSSWVAPSLEALR